MNTREPGKASVPIEIRIGKTKPSALPPSLLRIYKPFLYDMAFISNPNIKIPTAPPSTKEHVVALSRRIKALETPTFPDDSVLEERHPYVLYFFATVSEVSPELAARLATTRLDYYIAHKHIKNQIIPDTRDLEERFGVVPLGAKDREAVIQWTHDVSQFTAQIPDRLNKVVELEDQQKREIALIEKEQEETYDMVVQIKGSSKQDMLLNNLLLGKIDTTYPNKEFLQLIIQLTYEALKATNPEVIIQLRKNFPKLGSLYDLAVDEQNKILAENPGKDFMQLAVEYVQRRQAH